MQSNNAFSGLTNDQVQRLLSLIEPSKTGYERLTGKSLWIIDSGESRHMIGSLQNLERKTPVPLISINFPNGVSAVANLEGNTTLSPKISLDKVLYIPNFSCN